MNLLPRRVRFRILVLALLLLVGLVLFLRYLSPPAADRSKLAARSTTAAELPLEKPQPTPSATPAKQTPAVPSKAERRALFSYVPAPTNAAELEERLPAPTLAFHYVKLDRELIAGKASPFWRQQPGEGKVELPLPNGRVLTVAIDHSEIVGAGRFTSVGQVEGHEASSRAVFAYNHGILHAFVEDEAEGNFTLRYGEGDVSQFFQVDPTQLGSCGGGIVPSLDPNAIAIKAQALARRPATAASGVTQRSVETTTPAMPSAAEAIGPTNAEIHLMMVYTQDVANAVGSADAVQSAFDLAVATVNSDLAHSQITARVKLVKIYPVTYDESGSAPSRVQQDALVALTTTADGRIDDVHPLRDQVGADLVSMVILRSNPDGNGEVAGLGYIMEVPSQASTSDWETNSQYAFSVVRYSYLNSQHVLSHELGHNLGCAHDRENASGPGAYSYSYGYRLVGTNGQTYHDIMAYDPGTRLAYFSNPEVTPSETGVGKPIGIAVGLVGESNVALTIERDAYEVSMYRLQQQTPANRGTLINVATLAYAGSGDQQLIGGFVVNGPAPKTVMVRAVGPGLAQLGVTGFLPNPTLKLYRLSDAGSVEVGRNDDWSAPQNGGASASTLATTAAQVGAFPLPAGSLDAVVLATLPATTGPVSYTANIESSAAGQTGTALVEAYEVGANSSRVINLATRGYIDAAKPMTAGFVIAGNAAETKRVVVRVRGPSLAQFGLVGADDPKLSLYNSSQQLLVVNDDFSTDSSLGNTTIESAIIASGYAPSNRREPCIIADLAPGSYTVVAEPFSSAAQPAAPGLAVIEVFEVP